MKFDAYKFCVKHKKGLKLTFATGVLANAFFICKPDFHTTIEPIINSIEVDDIMLSDLSNNIYNSNRLNDTEKEYLYNRALLVDVLPYINQSNYMKRCYNVRFKNIDIKSYSSDSVLYGDWDGFYNVVTPSTLHVADYEDPYESSSTVGHEFIHMLQNPNIYSFFSEASAEIMSFEYYDNPVTAYTDEVKLLRVLMEIIGSEPIKQYVFAGDFSLIESRVKPYLTDEEYQEFIRCISLSTEDPNNVNDRNVSLRKIYKTLYEKIYESNIEDDNIIHMIEANKPSLYRYYFNGRKESYYGIYYIEDNVLMVDNVYLPSIAKREELFKSTTK